MMIEGICHTLGIPTQYLPYLGIFACVFAANHFMSIREQKRFLQQAQDNARRRGMVQQNENLEDVDDDGPDPPRNFTVDQLRFFDGKVDEKTGENKPVYFAVNGTVFDVSDGRDFYGPGGPYELFAGHECGVALAKFSFDDTYLDDYEGCKNLNFGEKEELNNWVEKFTHCRMYPILGKLIPDKLLPDSNRILTKEDIAKCDGTGDAPEGYAFPPIYVAAGEKVYDMSFGGVTFYGPNCSYHRFAGKDASRALAKMSFDPSDTANSDTSDLTEKELKVLSDWITTFETRKNYPCVGRIQK